MALAGQMIKLIRAGPDQQTSDGGDVIQVGIMQEQRTAVDLLVTKEFVDPGTPGTAASADQSVNNVALG